MAKKVVGFKSDLIKSKCAQVFGRPKIGASATLVASNFKLELTQEEQLELERRFSAAHERLFAEG